MRNQLVTLAIAALLGVPFAVNAETYMPSDDQIQPGMSEGDRVDTTEVLDSSETMKAEIVEIEGNRLITELQNGDQLVFLLEGSPENLNVGDELELKVDDQAKSAVILNVLPKDKERQS
jgi:sRNA-binding protein